MQILVKPKPVMSEAALHAILSSNGAAEHDSSSNVASSVNVSVSASDNFGVSRVELYVDAQLVAQAAGGSAAPLRITP